MTNRCSAAVATVLALGAALSSCLTPPARRVQSATSETLAASGLPARLAWNSSAPLIVPKSDADHDLVAVKDPTVVRYDDRWHVYATSVKRGGVYGMIYVSFADWAEAPNAPFYYMDETTGFDTYVAAPQLFYFAPGRKWYLVFQSGPPMFSTADVPGDPTQWTQPAPFFAKTPPIVEKNGGWLDFWVICDQKSCHLFFSNDHGRWYQSKTPIEKFPNGFDTPVVVMEDAEAGRLFEACNVYKIGGTNKYLALIEAFDSSSSWKRYFRSWTADSLDGPWKVLHDDAALPFAGRANVAFHGTPWSVDMSHGELLRAGYDETMVIDGTSLRLLYQGFPPSTNTSDYNSIPWQLGLLTAR